MKPEDVSSFEVLRVMSERNLDIRLAPLDNVINLQKTKAGTQVLIGVGGDVIGGIANGQFIGGLLLADKEQFNKLRAEIAAAAEGKA